LHRFRSGLFRAIRAIKETGYGSKPVNGFAQFSGDTINGFDGVGLVHTHGQAASASHA